MSGEARETVREHHLYHAIAATGENSVGTLQVAFNGQMSAAVSAYVDLRVRS
jgi:hypothetical protein